MQLCVRLIAHRVLSSFFFFFFFTLISGEIIRDDELDTLDTAPAIWSTIPFSLVVPELRVDICLEYLGLLYMLKPQSL